MGTRKVGKRTVVSGREGKYDDIVERLSLDLKAKAVVLVVIDGRLGSGMSVSIDPRREGAFELAQGGGLALIMARVAEDIARGYGPEGVVVAEFGPEKNS